MDLHSTAQQQLDRIRTNLVHAMQTDDDGPYWLTPYYDKQEKKFLSREYAELFNGGAGIALFFMGLYESRQTQEDLLLAQQIINRILRSPYVLQPRFYCFYTGVTGIIYACIRLHELTTEAHYLQQALQLARLHQEGITTGMREMDLLSGAAGNLWVMTLLFHYSAADDILELVHRLIRLMLQQARISGQGVKWDCNKLAFDSLTGFSHGASGMAFVLLEVGQYFQYKGLIYLAEQALAYEMQYYDASAGNWLDLRLGAHRFNLPGAHTWQLEVFLPELKPVNAWAHGAAGIGLARLLAHAVTGNPLYAAQCRHALERCRMDVAGRREDYTLCSGYAGMVTFLLEASRHFSGLDTAALVADIVVGATALYNQKDTYNTLMPANQWDMGLLSGQAGVGDMLLTVLAKGKRANILCPRLPLPRQPFLPAYTVTEVKQALWGKYYARTIGWLNVADVAACVAQAQDIDDFGRLLTSFAQELPAPAKMNATDLVLLETQLADLWKQHKGYLCFYKQYDYLDKAAARLAGRSDTVLLKLMYCLPQHVRLWYTRYHPDNSGEGQTINTYTLVVQMTSGGIEEMYVGKLVELVLAQLVEPVTGKTLLNKIIRQTGAAGTEQQQRVQQLLVAQLRELVKSRLVQFTGAAQ